MIALDIAAQGLIGQDLPSSFSTFKKPSISPRAIARSASSTIVSLRASVRTAMSSASARVLTAVAFVASASASSLVARAAISSFSKPARPSFARMWSIDSEHRLRFLAQTALVVLADQRFHQALDHRLQPVIDAGPAGGDHRLGRTFRERVSAELAAPRLDEHLDHQLHNGLGAVGIQQARGEHHAMLGKRPRQVPATAPIGARET